MTETEKTPAQLWVEALRSGRYTQVQGYLSIKYVGHCCLGVACEVYREHVGRLNVREQPQHDGVVILYDGQEACLPKCVADWLGIDSAGSYNNNDGVCAALYQDNDDGIAFAEIADIIESRPDGLFATEPAHAH